MIYKGKLEAIAKRSGMNIRSGKVMMEVKDRDWLLETVNNFGDMIEKLERELEIKHGLLRGTTPVK